MTESPRPPAHVAPYVEVLGVELAVEFLLGFGGARLNLPKNPSGGSKAEAMIGKAHMIALYERAGELGPRIPTAKPWIAAVMKSKGLSTSEIARRLHVTDATVRNWRNKRRDTRQLDFFEPMPTTMSSASRAKIQHTRKP